MFLGADLSYAIFDSQTDLSFATLRQADLSFAVDFDLALLERTEFDSSTKFPDGLDWKTTSFFSEDLRGMKIYFLEYEDISYQDLSPYVDPRYIDFSYGWFLRANATGATFNGNNLTEAYLQAIIAPRADFTNSILRDATSEYSNFNEASFLNADMSGMKLLYSEFEGADLTGATFDDSTNFTFASFNGNTKFDDGNGWKTTSFFTTDLRNMKLVLDNEDIAGVDLSAQVNLRFRDLSGSSMVRTTAHGARFQGNDLTDAYLQAIYAEDIDFTGANLTGVTSQYSNLQRAIFTGSKMVGMDVGNSDLRGCNLVAADLTGIVYNDQTKFGGCKYDEDTNLPADFDAVALGLVLVTESVSAFIFHSITYMTPNLKRWHFRLYQLSRHQAQVALPL